MTTGPDIRAAAARAVADVAARGRSLEQALPDRLDALAGGDRSLAANLVYGTVRWHPRLEAYLDLLLTRRLKPAAADVHGLLLVGLFQLEETRVPDHAAVAETVEATRRLGQPRLAGLVNGCLRRWLREGDSLKARVARQPEVVHAHPRWWLDALAADWPRCWEAIVAAANQRAPMWVRVNRRRSTRDDYRRRLEEATGVAAQAWCPAPEALMLSAPVDVAALPGFEDGDVSVQDGAAQLAAGLVDPQPGMRILDACAAPGGKTCHLLERCPEARLLALDANAERLERVTDNLARLDLSAVVAAGDARHPETWWDGEPFQRILVDAPCTGSGVVRRHPDIRLLRRPGDVDAMAAVQAEMLDALWPLLAPAGRLVYATCSVFKAENARQVAGFLGRQPRARAVDLSAASWGRDSGPGRQLLPGDAGVDGFYYACLEKRTQDHAAFQA
ncbi:MAG: 16S rRNA (cytosine(967)-C(5))-methyltransferase RsmB [Gammaproteobacteria bacterium]